MVSLFSLALRWFVALMLMVQPSATAIEAWIGISIAVLLICLPSGPAQCTCAKGESS